MIMRENIMKYKKNQEKKGRDKRDRYQNNIAIGGGSNLTSKY